MDEISDPSQHAFGLFSRDEADLMVTYAFSCVGAIIVWGALVAIGVKVASPEVSIQAALGIGVFAGIWASPLFGGVAGIGIYEARKKARGESTH
ncbi:MAG: hypothetical protein GY929_22930 [Actinomycetia bacterium]|nr:hypothetical protein [Actinomycetes bacterium]